MESADEVHYRPIKSSISGGRFDGNYFGVQHAACDSINYKAVLGLHGPPQHHPIVSDKVQIMA